MTAPTILQLLTGQADRAPPPISEAIVARLREAGERYAAFARGETTPPVGALMTPRSDSQVSGSGRPFLVIESRHPPLEPDPRNGLRCDVRVLLLHEQDNDTIASLWMESWWLEPWTEAHVQMARPPEGSA